MQRRMMLGLATASLCLLTAAISNSAHAAEHVVNIDNFTFGPAEITIAAGDTVTWTNRDDIPHTVTDAAPERRFKSTVLDTDQKFSFVFTTPGTYRYFCSLHPHMQGTVVVR